MPHFICYEGAGSEIGLTDPDRNFVLQDRLGRWWCCCEADGAGLPPERWWEFSQAIAKGVDANGGQGRGRMSMVEAADRDELRDKLSLSFDPRPSSGEPSIPSLPVPMLPDFSTLAGSRALVWEVLKVAAALGSYLDGLEHLPEAERLEVLPPERAAELSASLQRSLLEWAAWCLQVSRTGTDSAPAA